MKILKTKWYIALGINIVPKKFQVLNLGPFATLKEAKSSGHFNPYKHLIAEGQWILRNPDKYIVTSTEAQP